MEGEEAEEEIMDPSNPMCELLVAAFLAMEPTDCLISLAKYSSSFSSFIHICCCFCYLIVHLFLWIKWVK